MKHLVLLAAIVGMGVTAVVLAERHRVDVPPGPSALLYLVADTEQELTRMPVRFTRMSDAEEVRIGDLIAQINNPGGKVRKNAETLEVEEYLQQVGSRLVPHAHRKLPYRFHYVEDRSFINAFALPGGHVYVGAGLLALMDSEDELAAVMAHELEHIDHYHCAERAQVEQALRKIPLGAFIALPVEVFEAGYSKDQELEADREGTRLAVAAGYSANGAVRLFETFQRLYQEYQTRAQTPQREVTDMALETLQGYFRSHPLPSERIAQVRQLIASEHWELRPERDLTVAYIFWNERAQDAFDAHRYQDAEHIAGRSLRVRPNQPVAWQLMAQAQFAQAEFADAAASYRKKLEFDPYNLEIARAYASSLAAADKRTAASEFKQWFDSIPGQKPAGLAVTLAGLSLLSETALSPQQLEALTNSGSDFVSNLGELGWWYYEAGDYQKAADLLSQAVQRRPGNATLALGLAWAQIELQRLSDALQTLESISDPVKDSRISAGRSMASAISYWQAMQPDAALDNFGTGITTRPEWDNPNWSRRLYSPLVVRSIEEMHAERERRLKIRLATSR